MKHQLFAYGVVAALSVLVGFLIAGPPNSDAVEQTIVPPPTTEAPPVTEAAVADTTTTSTTTTPATTLVATTTIAQETTTTVPAPELPDRADEVVVVANGANISGIAGRTRDQLEVVGYTDVRVTDGTEIVFFTIVYYVDGAEESAERLAADLGLPATSVAPMADAPSIIGDLDGEDLLVYIGGDLG